MSRTPTLLGKVSNQLALIREFTLFFNIMTPSGTPSNICFNHCFIVVWFWTFYYKEITSEGDL